MSYGFVERRHDFREPVDEGTVSIGAQRFRLVNWSSSGFLAEGVPPPAAVGTEIRCTLTLQAGDKRFAFTCTARIVRAGPPGTGFAARFEYLEPDTAVAVQRHFNPYGAAITATAGVAYTRVLPPPPPPPPEDAAAALAEDAAALSLEWGLETITRQSTAGGDPVELRRQLARLKAAVARRYHPDAGEDPTDRRLRAEIFARVWEKLEDLEAGIGRTPQPDTPPESGRRLR